MPALLTSWSANREREISDLIWDLTICPILYGPVSLLDNMICDNVGLYRLLTEGKIEYCELIKKYTRNGLIKLWHREYYISKENKIHSVEGILLNWLCRDDSNGLYQVGFGILTSKGNANEVLRSMIRKHNKENSTTTKRLKSFYEFIHVYYPNYKKFVDLLNQIFFAQKASFVYKTPPVPLQQRIIGSFGIQNKNIFLAREGKIEKHPEDLYLLNDKEIDSNVGFSKPSLLELAKFAKDDLMAKHFFHLLVNKNDAPVTELLETLEKIDHKQARVLRGHIVNVYDSAIPEANNELVLVEKKTKEPSNSAQLHSNINDIALEFNRIKDFSRFVMDDNEDPVSGAKKNLRELGDILFPAQNYFPKINKQQIRRQFFAAASTVTVLSTLRDEITPILQDYPFEIFLCQFYILLAGFDPGKAIKVIFHQPVRSTATVNYKLKADFYKYANFTIANTEFL